MSVLDYVDVGVYLYQKIHEGKEEKWIIKDINKRQLLIQNKETGRIYKMNDRELEALYKQRKIRISKKGDE